MDKLIDKEISVIRYFEGDMTDLEKSEFEKLIQSSPEIKSLCDEYKSVFHAIEKLGDQELRSTIQRVEKELTVQDFFAGKKDHTQDNRSYIFNPWQRLAIAAAILVLIVSFVFLWLTSSNNSERALFTKYYAAETMLTQKILHQFNQKGLIQSTGPIDSISECIVLYKDRKYNECITRIHSLSNELANTPVVSFYLGLCLVEVLDFEKADPILASLCLNTGFEWKDDACWYYGLSLLGQGTKSAATRELFKQISNSGNSKYSLKAKEIFSTLSR
jgi:ElaB/YqjD/DUF883 family membrane-anchored ribosome-binding protein